MNAARLLGSPGSDPLRASHWPFQVVELKPMFGRLYSFLHLEGGPSELVSWWDGRAASMQDRQRPGLPLEPGACKS